ncbi:protocadherin gamma-C5-like isoform X13 [Pelobates fuscus]|uniref:protocadherin gamma-C5-like isoform X13 n=1 Tax=Pelobates fuscus TaxID=191477 RepID=UPI002FE4B943
MDFRRSLLAWNWQVVCICFLCSWGWVCGQLRYSILEESEPGTLIGNIAQDLGIKKADILPRRLNLVFGEKNKYLNLNKGSGALSVNERIDRESLCESILNCILHLKAATENPLELYNLEIEILDINDNSPTFLITDSIFEITELVTIPGVRFPLEIAQDLDVGVNDIKQYTLNPNPYFSLSVKNRKDGTLIPQLILEKILDREEKREHKLVLTAIDGGEPVRSGSCQITIKVLDINDNAPVFDQSIYKISLKENIPLKTIILSLNATDLDEGPNADVEYYFDGHTSDSARKLFDLDTKTGKIYNTGIVDFEDNFFYELSVRAADKGSPKLEGSCLIQVEIEDVNDNSPEITFSSIITEIAENAPLGTVVGFVSVTDKDSGRNGEVHVNVSPNLPFKIKPFQNHFSLVTDGYLDRETLSQYIIELVASDLGTPALHTHTSILLHVSDINDNSPIFSQSMYNVFVKENNDPGTFLTTVSAYDIDEGINAELIYSIVESSIEGSSVSSYIYINPSNGNIYAQRSFDYEQIQVFQIIVKVADSGSLKLFSNASIGIFILDANDNYPHVINQDISGDVVFQEKIPKSATAGYLATKISAVDKDSGHNAWLQFSLLEPANSSLFQISLFTGEVRTVRNFHETDNPEQQLVILISDHGDPPLSSTVTVLLNIADNAFIENHKTQDSPLSSKPPSDLTLYLIVSLVAISLVSILTFIILLVKCLRKEDSYNSSSCCSLCRPQSKLYTEQYKPTLYLNTDGTLKYMEVRMVPPEPQGQCYQTCLPLVSDQPNFTFMKSQNIPHLTDEPNSQPDTGWLNDPSQQAQPNTEWRFSQAQRPGPSGAQPTEEAGVWPNNQFETERLQAMILASANEAAEGTSGLGGGTGTMGLSARYGPQFTLQHVPDYRQNVYIPGSTLTPTNGAGKREGKASGNKKKSGKKEKK